MKSSLVAVLCTLGLVAAGELEHTIMNVLEQNIDKINSAVNSLISSKHVIPDAKFDDTHYHWFCQSKGRKGALKHIDDLNSMEFVFGDVDIDHANDFVSVEFAVDLRFSKDVRVHGWWQAWCGHIAAGGEMSVSVRNLHLSSNIKVTFPLSQPTEGLGLQVDSSALVVHDIWLDDIDMQWYGVAGWFNHFLNKIINGLSDFIQTRVVSVRDRIKSVFNHLQPLVLQKSREFASQAFPILFDKARVFLRPEGSSRQLEADKVTVSSQADLDDTPEELRAALDTLDKGGFDFDTPEASVPEEMKSALQIVLRGSRDYA